ncbi:MAG: bifunctional isocitrate dehydrogenase kinase/phosphatase, partial [Acidimicrobiia bacterium]|nr:bifunctional isocitrate dehydrogenase kinase/phosphatase [Acidimicrobiia bacterium]
MTEEAPAPVEIAERIRDAFSNFEGEFLSITRRAQARFARREWDLFQFDARERLGLHRAVVDKAVARLEPLIPPEPRRRSFWQETRSAYAGLIAGQQGLELAETFFNSVTRRLFTTIGVDEDLEFRWFGATAFPRSELESVAVATFHDRDDLEATIGDVLDSFRLGVDFTDPTADAELVAHRLRRALNDAWGSAVFDGLDMLMPVFYRNKGAYLIGRLRRLNRVIPFILPILNTHGGISVDAVLVSESAASRLFSFTRSYFHVEWENTGELIGFLKSILPMKPIAELYTALGYNQHGKTALYRAFYR